MHRMLPICLALLFLVLGGCKADPPEQIQKNTTPPRENYGQWNKVELPNTYCSDGSQYKFFVNFSDTSDNLVVAFEPGGACWDYGSCSPNGGLRGAANPNGISDNHATIWQLIMPVISRVHADNAMKDYNFVFLPYCTGDVFGGDQVATYNDPKGSGDSIVFHHVGHPNMMAVTQWLGQQFSQVPKLFVTGISAGGVGSLINYYFIRNAIPGVERGYLLDDSGPFFPESKFSAPLYAKVSQSWNVDTWIYDDLPSNFDTSDFGSINTALADEFPQDRIAHTFFLRDYNFSLYSYETFYDFPPKSKVLDMWKEDTQNLLKQCDQRDNLAAFIPYFRNVNCSHGTMLAEHKGTEIEALGVDVGDFIDLLLDNDRPLKSFVEDAQPQEDTAATPECEMAPSDGP